MTQTLHLTVNGHPATQGSKKAFIRGKRANLVEMDKKLPAWRHAVETGARKAASNGWETADRPVKISGEIRLPKPRTTKHRDAPAGPPDLDKLQRAIGDALTRSGVIKDDSRITHWDIKKVWTTTTPGIDITITEASQEPAK